MTCFQHLKNNISKDIISYMIYIESTTFQTKQHLNDSLLMTITPDSTASYLVKVFLLHVKIHSYPRYNIGIHI